MYDPKYTKTFYDAYGTAEWSRLEATGYGRLQAIVHEDFVKRHVKAGNRVLDAGSGPGRFSITAAKLGARVTMLDISPNQLAQAKQKIVESGLSDKIDRSIESDICDLSALPAGHFDVTICFGGPLSYVCEKREQAVNELLRVTRKGGFILVSVMSHYGAALGVTHRPFIPYLENPDTSPGPGIPSFSSVLETGDLPGFPSQRAGMQHAPMHMFTAEGLLSLFSRCEVLEIAGSNVTISEGSPAGDQILENPAAWKTLVKTELKLNRDPGLVNTGSHIILACRR